MKAFWYNEKRKNKCGLRIRELRQQQGLTIQKLSVRAQLRGYETITPNAISKAELGIRFIPDYEVSIFAELLNTTSEDLLTLPRGEGKG